MNMQNTIGAVIALFMLGMIWLRTRTQYARPRAKLHLRSAGRIYFACVAVALAAVWALAPTIGPALVDAAGATPTLARAVGSLGVYYAFIIVHRVLRSRQVAVYGTHQEPS